LIGARPNVPILFMGRDPRTLRLHDIQPQDVLTAQCPCGHIGRFAKVIYSAGSAFLRTRWSLTCYTGCATVIAGATRAPASSCGRVKPMMSRSPHDIGHYEVTVEGDINDRFWI
jgi:hypothetical protein